MSKEPVKHAPGVVCIIRVRYRSHGEEIRALDTTNANILRELREIEGRVCTITGPLRPFVLASGQRVDLTAAYGDHPAWMVQADAPLPLFVHFKRLFVSEFEYLKERPLLQANLIPIAGPGIDLGVDTDVVITKEKEAAHG